MAAKQKEPNSTSALGVTIPESINSADLTQSQSTPKITPINQSSSTAGLFGAVESVGTQLENYLKENKKQAETNKNKSLSDLTTALFEAPTTTELTGNAYGKKGGVDELQSQLDDINSQLLVEKQALVRETERIQKNSVGASADQINNMVQEAEAKSLRKQADISIIQMGLQGKYNTAKSIADRAVDAAMERQMNVIEALKINYGDNKEMFTTAEQREYENLISKREREFEKERDEAKQISDYSLEAMKMGAPGDIITAIRNAKTSAEAQSIASTYMQPIIAQERALDLDAKRASNAASWALANQRSTDQAASVEQYANDMDALAGNVLSTIPTKFGQQQFQNQLSRARDDADRLNIIASQVLKTAGAEVKRDFANQAVGISEIDKAINLLDQGVATGVFQAGAQYLYNIAGKDFDPKLAQINQHLVAAIQPYRNSVTGAAWGNQEDQEYNQLFGSTKYEPQALRQRLEQVKEVLKTKSATTLNAYANPMGYGDNQFLTGAYELQNTAQVDESMGVFDEIMGTAGTTAQTTSEGGYLSNLWSAIMGR